MPEQLPHDKQAALDVTIFASTGLTVMMLEYFWLLRDEIKFIWSWSVLRSSWKVRIYVVTRYVGLLSQIFNVYFSVRMYLGVYTSPAGCQVWFSFQATVVQMLHFFVEYVLMNWVYCLFVRSRVILWILISLFLVQMASMIVSARLSFPRNRTTVTCLVVRGSESVAVFSTTTLLTHLVVFVMAFWRFIRIPGKWVHEGIGRVIVRDSAVSLSAILLTMLLLTLISLRVIDPHTSSNTTYYWLVCILWVSAGRVVIDQARLQRETGEKDEVDVWRGTVQLTSMIEMGESTLTVESTAHGTSDPDARLPKSDRSLSTPTTKASQIPSSSASTSGDGRKSMGGQRVMGIRGSPRPSTATLEPSVEVCVTKESEHTSEEDCPGTGASVVSIPEANGESDQCAQDRAEDSGLGETKSAPSSPRPPSLSSG